MKAWPVWMKARVFAKDLHDKAKGLPPGQCSIYHECVCVRLMFEKGLKPFGMGPSIGSRFKWDRTQAQESQLKLKTSCVQRKLHNITCGHSFPQVIAIRSSQCLASISM